MRVLITGAAGFLGKECVRVFRDRSHEVLTTDRSGAVDFVGDLADAGFAATLPDVDTVINCAAVQYVSADLPLFFRQRWFRRNNVDSARNLCARYRDGATHLVQVGTSMMYRQSGAATYGIGSPMGGEGVYSRSKMAAQAFFDEIPGVATVIPCIIGGKGREGLFKSFVRMAGHGFVAFPGQGRHRIHMVHVADVAALILRIAEIRSSGFFNAAAPDPLSIRQWIDEIGVALNLHRIVKFSIPLLPVKWLAWLSCYRLLAREQVLMLEHPHVLKIDESLAIGWQPEFTNARIIAEIARHVAGASCDPDR